MRKLIALFLIVASSSVLTAQDFAKPKQGAKIYFDTYEVTATPSSETKVEFWLVRSKRATKAKFGMPKFMGSKDLEVTVIRDEQNPDHFYAVINPNGVENGKYFYTVSGGSAGSHKVTGTTVSIIVGNTSMISKNN